MKTKVGLAWKLTEDSEDVDIFSIELAASDLDSMSAKLVGIDAIVKG